jgi:hypothetical protein
VRITRGVYGPVGGARAGAEAPAGGPCTILEHLPVEITPRAA